MFAKLSQQDLYVSLNYNIEYSGAPEDWVERSGLPRKAEALVEGSGFSVLGQWMDPFRSAQINLSKLLPSDFQFSDQGSISDSLLKTSLSLNHSSTIHHKWIWIKGLEFEWPELVRKKLELNVDYKGELEKKGYSFIANSIVDSLSIVAPKAYLDSISDYKWIALYSGKFKGRGEHYLIFEIENPFPKHILIEPKSFEAKVEIRRTTTLKRRVPIVARGFNPSNTLEMVPAFIECTLVVEFGEYEEMLSIPIFAFVHKNQISDGRAPIELEFPEGASMALLTTDVSSTQVFVLE